MLWRGSPGLLTGFVWVVYPVTCKWQEKQTIGPNDWIICLALRLFYKSSYNSSLSIESVRENCYQLRCCSCHFSLSFHSFCNYNTNPFIEPIHWTHSWICKESITIPKSILNLFSFFYSKFRNFVSGDSNLYMLNQLFWIVVQIITFSILTKFVGTFNLVNGTT